MICEIPAIITKEWLVAMELEHLFSQESEAMILSDHVCCHQGWQLHKEDPSLSYDVHDGCDADDQPNDLNCVGDVNLLCDVDQVLVNLVSELFILEGVALTEVDVWKNYLVEELFA